jgi:hypothetical protein
MSDTMMQPTQSTMKAIALDRFGGLETMKLQMLPVPEVGPGEVLIHVEWAGVGKWDPFSERADSPRHSASSRSFPMYLAPMAPAPLRLWAMVSRGSTQASASTLSAS